MKFLIEYGAGAVVFASETIEAGSLIKAAEHTETSSKRPPGCHAMTVAEVPNKHSNTDYRALRETLDREARKK